ncbi:hypothetical protein WMY93_012679 [Mugilogobius chulae]|uniref:Metalloendopeptidase n=1 Tax=Mugilogobius chulae TaxID=88201 RepID=A0AAW0NY52_9GOBI
MLTFLFNWDSTGHILDDEDVSISTLLEKANKNLGKDFADPPVVEGDIVVPYGLQNADPCTARAVCGPKPVMATSMCPTASPTSTLLLLCGPAWGAQVVSLARQGCVFQSTIQHELLHALGFNHEQTRSDRDTHVRILLQNVIRGMEFNFRRIQTRNLGTPYDYNSVMHYGRFAFSSNRQPTIVPIPDANVAIGRATQMSPTDILRVNRLYNCSQQL